MKNKIEDILMHMESNHDDMGIAREEATKDITTLIQEERRIAIEDFYRGLPSIQGASWKVIKKYRKKYIKEYYG